VAESLQGYAKSHLPGGLECLESRHTESYNRKNTPYPSHPDPTWFCYPGNKVRERFRPLPARKPETKATIFGKPPWLQWMKRNDRLESDDYATNAFQAMATSSKNPSLSSAILYFPGTISNQDFFKHGHPKRDRGNETSPYKRRSSYFCAE
jgi:hypothetical protein